MEDLNPNLQITLNVNYLNNYKAEVMILNKMPAPTLFCQKENHFQHNSRIKLKVKVYHTKKKPKKDQLLILMSNQVDFKAMNTRDKGIHFIVIN